MGQINYKLFPNVKFATLIALTTCICICSFSLSTWAEAQNKFFDLNAVKKEALLSIKNKKTEKEKWGVFKEIVEALPATVAITTPLVIYLSMTPDQEWDPYFKKYADQDLEIKKNSTRPDRESNAGDSDTSVDASNNTRDQISLYFKRSLSIVSVVFPSFLMESSFKSLKSSMTHYMQNTFKRISKSATKSLSGFWGVSEKASDETKVGVLSYVNNYLKKHNFIETESKQAIDSNLKALKTLLASDDTKTSNIKSKIENIFTGVEDFFRLPKNVKAIYFSDNEKANLASSIQNFPTRLKSDLENLILKMVEKSHISTKPDQNRPISFFKSDLESKTNEILNSLQEIFDLPMIRIDLGQFNDPVDFLQKHLADNPVELNLEKYRRSWLTSSFINKKSSDGENYKNAIIVFDNMDQLINHNDKEKIKRLLVKLSKQQNLFLPDLGIQLDLHRSSLIFTGSRIFNDELLLKQIEIIDLNKTKPSY